MGVSYHRNHRSYQGTDDYLQQVRHNKNKEAVANDPKPLSNQNKVRAYYHCSFCKGCSNAEKSTIETFRTRGV